MLIINKHKLFYFEQNNTLEIDFIFEQNNNIIPLEVKLGFNTKSKL